MLVCVVGWLFGWPTSRMLRLLAAPSMALGVPLPLPLPLLQAPRGEGRWRGEGRVGGCVRVRGRWGCEEG